MKAADHTAAMLTSWVAPAANVAHAEVYLRPARGGAWPQLCLDDVAVAVALEVLRRHGTCGLP